MVTYGYQFYLHIYFRGRILTHYWKWNFPITLFLIKNVSLSRNNPCFRVKHTGQNCFLFKFVLYIEDGWRNFRCVVTSLVYVVKDSLRQVSWNTPLKELCPPPIYIWIGNVSVRNEFEFICVPRDEWRDDGIPITSQRNGTSDRDGDRNQGDLTHHHNNIFHSSKRA